MMTEIKQKWEMLLLLMVSNKTFLLTYKLFLKYSYYAVRVLTKWHESTYYKTHTHFWGRALPTEKLEVSSICCN